MKTIYNQIRLKYGEIVGYRTEFVPTGKERAMILVMEDMAQRIAWLEERLREDEA